MSKLKYQSLLKDHSISEHSVQCPMGGNKSQDKAAFAIQFNKSDCDWKTHYTGHTLGHRKNCKSTTQLILNNESSRWSSLWMCLLQWKAYKEHCHHYGISAGNDGGPRSRVFACLTLHSAPHRLQTFFSACVWGDLTNFLIIFSQFQVILSNFRFFKKLEIWPLGGSKKKFSHPKSFF